MGRLCTPLITSNNTLNTPPTVLRRTKPVKMPVLQFWADNDAALEPSAFTNAEEWAEDIEVHEIKVCSHWIPFDRPNEINTLMRAFLGAA